MFITPASRQPIKDVFEHELLFGGVTQTLALEDNMWGYNLMVSERYEKGGSTSMKSILTTTMPSVDPKQSDRTDIGNMCHGTYIMGGDYSVTVAMKLPNPNGVAG